MDILIDKVRVLNFRSLKNIEVNLEPMTLLVVEGLIISIL